MSKIISPVVEGIKDSFKLSASLVLAIGSVISSFAQHSLELRDTGVKQPPARNASPHDHGNDRRAAAG